MIKVPNLKLSLLLLVIGMSCSDDRDKIIGKWKINFFDSEQNLKQTFSHTELDPFIEFDEDNSWRSNRYRGSWIVFGSDEIGKHLDIIVQRIDMENEVKLAGEYTLVGNKLKIKGFYHLGKGGYFGKATAPFFLELEKY